MRKKLLLLFIVISITGFTRRVTSDKFVRGCEGWGFNAEFLWVLNHIHWCITHQKTPVVYWGSSFAFFSPSGYNGSTNCWEYYFEPVSNLVYQNNDRIATQHWYENFSTIWNYDQYIENLSLIEIDIENKFFMASNGQFPKGERYPVTTHLYNESFRKYVKEQIIDKFIVIKKNITDIANLFYLQEIAGKKTIAIHLRGKFAGNEVPLIPSQAIFNEANKYADENTQFFVATDQIALLEEAKKILKGKVLFYESERYNGPALTVPNYPKLNPLLGENLLIEMLLLSRCDYFIHTISNISTTVLYFNPTLKHTFLY